MSHFGYHLMLDCSGCQGIDSRDNIFSWIKELVPEIDMIAHGEPVIEYLAEKGYDKKMGARPLARKIDELIRVPLSKKILFERIKNAQVTASIDDGKVQFNIFQHNSARVNEDGIIEIS